MKSNLMLAAIMAIALSSLVIAQGPPKQEPKVQTVRPGQSEADAKSTQGGEPEADAAALSRAIHALSDQVQLLTAELRKLRRDNERNSQMLELLLCEQKLNWFEDKILNLQERKAQLAAREQEIQYRLKNIQQEMVMRGLLRREEVEAAARADLQRALDDVRNQQALVQQQLAKAEVEAEQLRQRITALRNKLKLAEEKNEGDRSDQKQN
jgi:chromosome segregation ATPase